MEGMKERRKHPRFPVKEGALVFASCSSYLGQIVDVSMGGLTFRYVTPAAPQNPLCKLEDVDRVDIVFGRKNFLLNDVPIKTVDDLEIGTFDSYNQQFVKRRRGVRFRDLTADQLFRLKRFILTMTHREVVQSFVESCANASGSGLVSV